MTLPWKYEGQPSYKNLLTSCQYLQMISAFSWKSNKQQQKVELLWLQFAFYLYLEKLPFWEGIIVRIREDKVNIFLPCVTDNS